MSEHFIQHFNYSLEDGLHDVGCGHCLKLRKLKCNCENYVEGTNKFLRTREKTTVTQLCRIEGALINVDKEVKKMIQMLKDGKL